MTLAPSDDRSVVTSTRATVIDVDPEAQAISIELADGRRHELAGDELAHDRLAHGYAVTVHRSQGATHDTGTPITNLLEVEDSYAVAPTESMALRLARVDHERDVLWSSIPIDDSADVAPEIQRITWLDFNPAMKARLDMLEFERNELARGLDPQAVAFGLSR